MPTRDTDMIRKIDELISPLVAKTAAAGSKLDKDDVNHIRDLVMKTRSNTGGTVQNLAEMAFIIIGGLIGKEFLNKLFDKAKTAEQLEDEIQKFIILSQNKEVSQEKNVRHRLLLNETTAGGDKRTKFKEAVNMFSMNYLNKWNIIFGDNKVIDELPINAAFEVKSLLSVYASDVTLPDATVERASIGLPYQSPNVSKLTRGDLSITFYCDSNMFIKKTIELLLEKVRSKYTGRYSYRDSYLFKHITVQILDNEMNIINRYKFFNCVIAGNDALSLSQMSSEVKQIALPFMYDWMEIDDEFTKPGQNKMSIQYGQK